MIKELIPFEKLQEGFDKCKQQIQNLLDASEILYAGKKYSIAVPLAILAIEETGKLRLIHDHIRSGSAISEQEWKELTKEKMAHLRKLTKTYNVGKEIIRSTSESLYYENMLGALHLGFGTDTRRYEIARETNKQVIDRLEKLDKIKQECLYVNWDKCNWTSLNAVNKPSKEALAYSIFLIAKTGFYSIIVLNRYPPTITQNSTEYQKFMTDPHVIELKGLHKKVISSETKKKSQMATVVIDQYFSSK